MEPDPIQTAAMIVAAVAQSGKMPSYEAKDVAAYFDIIYRQIFISSRDGTKTSILRDIQRNQ